MKLFKNFETELKIVHVIKWATVVLFLIISFMFTYQYRLDHRFPNIFVSVLFFLSSFVNSLELVGKAKLTKINLIMVVGFYLYAISVFSFYILGHIFLSVITLTISILLFLSIIFFKKQTIKITDYIFTNYNKMIDI